MHKWIKLYTILKICVEKSQTIQISEFLFC